MSWVAIFVQVLLWLTSYTTMEIAGILQTNELVSAARFAEACDEQFMITALFMAAPRLK
jgi:hypothetical protein